MNKEERIILKEGEWFGSLYEPEIRDLFEEKIKEFDSSLIGSSFPLTVICNIDEIPLACGFIDGTLLIDEDMEECADGSGLFQKIPDPEAN